LNYNLRPWIRFGLNYEFSKYKREQRFGVFQPVPAMLDVEGKELVANDGGITYRKMWTMYHNADLTFEFNLAQILWNRKRESGRFNLYAGAGIGMMFAKGNTYTLGMGYERWEDPDNYQDDLQVSDNWASRAWVEANNTRHNFKAPYIPVVLSAEYDVSPRVTLGLKGQYKALIGSDKAMAPKSVGAVAFVLRYNILGAKQGVRSNKAKYNELAGKYDALQTRYDTHVGEADRARTESENSLRSLNAENEALKKQLSAAAAPKSVPPPAKAEEKNDISVLFELGSAVVSEEAAAQLKTWAEYLRANENVTISFVGEASADGNPTVNQKLSEQRLANVIEILNGYGIGSDRIKQAEAIGDANKVYQRKVEITINK
jgi:outer membrane protein OmpA-like peptidoglycan-associated protein